MDKATIYKIYAGVTVMVLVSLKLIIGGMKPQNSKSAKAGKTQKQLRLLYKIFSASSVTNQQLLKIHKRLSALSIYSYNELQELSTKYLLTVDSVLVGLTVAVIYLSRDTLSVFIGIAFGLVVNTVLINKQIDKVNLKVYIALQHSISSIRQEYLISNDVSESLVRADIDKLLTKPMTRIHQIITGLNSEIELLKFYESSPFRPLQTLAAICYNIHNYGDEKDETGQQNFISALSILTFDINAEIENLTLMKSTFGIIEYLPFVPIFAIPLLEKYFVGIIPGTALIYNGLIGYTGRVLTLISCIFCYSIIANINSSNSVSDEDKVGWIFRLSRNEVVNGFIINIIPKGTKKNRLEIKLKEAISRKTVEYFYTEKLLTSILTFVVASFLIVFSISMSRGFIINSTQQLSLVASNEMDKYSSEQILSLDESYFNREHEWSPEEFKSNITAHMPGLTELQMQDQEKRLKDKESSLKVSYFHWYYTFIIYAVAVGGWFIPNLKLMLRGMLIRVEAVDDFFQLQTLMAILMNMTIDTLECIWQMCQNSRVHKQMLLYCYHSYVSNPEMELTRLKSKTPIIEFKRFIGKLIPTISETSIKEAFGDLKVEREHMAKLRHTQTEKSIAMKRMICGMLAMLPIGLFVLFELLIPIGYLGFMEFTNALSSMKNA